MAGSVNTISRSPPPPFPHTHSTSPPPSHLAYIGAFGIDQGAGLTRPDVVRTIGDISVLKGMAIDGIIRAIGVSIIISIQRLLTLY
jgi:hypothetical protein